MIAVDERAKRVRSLPSRCEPPVHQPLRRGILSQRNCGKCQRRHRDDADDGADAASVEYLPGGKKEQEDAGEQCDCRG